MVPDHVIMINKMYKDWYCINFLNCHNFSLSVFVNDFKLQKYEKEHTCFFFPLLITFYIYKVCPEGIPPF